MAGLWIDLEVTLARLDVLAADQERLLEDRNCLPGLQYELHRAAELVSGLAPPLGAEALHEELAQALAEARELTAELSEALACRRDRGRGTALVGVARRPLPRAFRPPQARAAEAPAAARTGARAGVDDRAARASRRRPSPSARCSCSSQRCSGCGCSSR